MLRHFILPSPISSQYVGIFFSAACVSPFCLNFRIFPGSPSYYIMSELWFVFLVSVLIAVEL